MALPIDHIRIRVGNHVPKLAEALGQDPHVHGAVAVIVRQSAPDSEVLLIRRAEREGDVWSGDIAFPGGRIDMPAETPRQAAERETHEEVGIDLTQARHLGRLDDLTGRTRTVLVSAFVYELPEPQDIVLNHEVSDTRWTSFAELGDKARQVRKSFDYEGKPIEMPGIRIFDDDAVPVLWGLTYRFLEVLMQIVGRPIPNMPWRSDL